MKFLSLIFLMICSQISAQIKAVETASYKFPKIQSAVTMPIIIPFSEIGNLVNNSVKDLIFEDDSFTDNNNDQFKVKVWKTRAIRLVGDANKNILIEVPIKIWAEKRIGTLGIYTYQNTTFETVMYFKTAISFKNNWSADTFTQPMGFKWVTKPVLDFGKVKIPITSLVEKSLKEQQYSFCKIIDEQMSSQLNLQPYAVLAWNSFAQPFLISDEYKTWLKITPISVNMTPLKFYGNQIETQIGINIFSETFTGEKPASGSPVKAVSDLNFVPKVADSFILQTTSNISFKEATTIARKEFLNKNFEIQGSVVKISDVKVYYDNGKVTVEAQTSGYINGKVLITGNPIYNPEKEKIVLTDTKFKLKTMDILQKTASVLYRNTIVKMIETDYGIPTGDIVAAAKKSVEEVFNKEYYKGIKLSGKVINLQPQQILLNSSGITAVIKTEARLKFSLKDL